MRLASWLTQAVDVIRTAFHHADRERGTGSPVFVVYESRPFLSGKQKQGRQSIQSVLSFGKSLALIRIALADALKGGDSVDRLKVGAVPPQWWQIRLLGDGVPLTGTLLDQAEERLTRARTPKGERRTKAKVLAAVYLRTGTWVEGDHQADSSGLAITVADQLSLSDLGSLETIADSRFRW